VSCLGSIAIVQRLTQGLGVFSPSLRTLDQSKAFQLFFIFRNAIDAPPSKGLSVLSGKLTTARLLFGVQKFRSIGHAFNSPRLCRAI